MLDPKVVELSERLTAAHILERREKLRGTQRFRGVTAQRDEVTQLSFFGVHPEEPAAAGDEGSGFYFSRTRSRSDTSMLALRPETSCKQL